MDMNQYIEIFVEESKENLQTLDSSLLELEKNPTNKDIINEIFRVAHTLKGMTGTMGFNKMMTLTHNMEDVLDAIRNDKFSIESNLVDVLFKCLDALETYVNNIINEGTEGEEDYDDIVSVLKKYAKGEIDSDTSQTQGDSAGSEDDDEEISIYDKNVINHAITNGMHAYKIRFVLSQKCLLRAARAFIIFQTLERDSEIIKSKPSVQDIEDELFEYEFTVVVISSFNIDHMKKELGAISEIDAIDIEEFEKQEIIEDSRDTNKETTDSDNKNSTKSLASSSKNKPQKPKKSTKTVRVDIKRLDNLMNLISELIITKTRLNNSDELKKNEEMKENVDYLDRITTTLHDAVMKVRMVPIEMVFNRFPRMIRDVAKDINKNIELVMFGEETELDRTVVDEIGDPLIHLLRNSADHGLETKDERAKTDKEQTGHIYLRAFHEGNNVVIEVEDDGKGINIARVKSKIIEKGLLEEEEANQLSDQEVIEYLFKPSFSTADAITDLSGRGVGLDVVKTKIESLGGFIEVFSEEGKGSKTTIRLPLTLAIVQTLMVEVQSEIYAIPIGSISSIKSMTPEDIKIVQKEEVIIVNDSIIPIIRGSEYLGFEKSTEDKEEITIVVIKKGEKLFGLIVDSLVGQDEVVIKSLGKLLETVKKFSGATILGDGNVALILDTNSISN